MGEGAVDRLIAEHRAEACAAGRKIALVYEIACAAPVAEFAAVEVACALTLSRFAAENLVALAHGLCDRLPAVLCALSHGDIDVPKARVFTEVLADLDSDTARTVAALVLPKAPSRTVGQLRDMLRRKALAADPGYATARRERATAHRSVQLHADDDGTASLTAFGLDAARATAAMQRITTIARHRRYTGDPASPGQLRADVLLELLEGKHDGAARGVVNLTVSLDTLARWNDDPASLGGYGVIAADIARQWLEQHPGYQWQYAIHHPTDGTLLQQGLTRQPPATTPLRHGHTRPSAASAKHDPATGTKHGPAGTLSAPSHRDRTRPGTAPASRPGAVAAGTGTARTSQPPRASAATDSCAQPPAAPASAEGDSLARPPVQNPRDRTANAAMTRWIRLRDKTCRAPGCRMPAWQSDLDHNQRYTDGGLTTHDNLCPLCRYHHRAKEEAGWVLVQTRPGHFIWISPQGRVYEIGPEPP